MKPNYMRSIYCFLISLLVTIPALAQIVKPQKIKILLLGTVHFTPSTQDKYKNESFMLTDKDKEKELNQVVAQLAKFKPDQICIERPVVMQRQIDSVYNGFLKGNYTLQQNEIDLLGFQTAKRLNLKGLTCINHLGRFDTDSMNKFAQSNSQTNILSDLDGHAKQFMAEISKSQTTLSLGNFLVFLNSKLALNKNLAIYTNYLVKVGKDTNYVGTDVVADWYNTNLHIYTNILRQTRSSDKAILVVFGQGHIPILKHLFESNPDFDVIEVEEVLR